MAQAGSEQAANVAAACTAAEHVALGLLPLHLRVYFRPRWFARVGSMSRKPFLVSACLYTNRLLAVMVAKANAEIQACTSNLQVMLSVTSRSVASHCCR